MKYGQDIYVNNLKVHNLSSKLLFKNYVKIVSVIKYFIII